MSPFPAWAEEKGADLSAFAPWPQVLIIILDLPTVSSQDANSVSSCQFPDPSHFIASCSYREGCLVTVVYFLLNFLIGFHCSIFYVFRLQYFTATFRFPESWYREQATKVIAESQVVPVLSLKEFSPIGPSRDRPKN